MNILLGSDLRYCNRETARALIQLVGLSQIKSLCVDQASFLGKFDE